MFRFICHLLVHDYKLKNMRRHQIKYSKYFSKFVATPLFNIILERQDFIIAYYIFSSLLLDGKNALLLWALHGYFVPTNKLVRKNNQGGKNDVIKYTIKDSQESFLFLGKSNQEIQEHLNFIKSRKKISSLLFCALEMV